MVVAGVTAIDVRDAVPVPLRLIVCVPYPSTTVSVPVIAPTEVGLNVTPNLHLLSDESVRPQLLLTAKFGEIVTLLIALLAPRLSNVTLCDALVLPVAVEGNDKLAGDHVRAAVPLPLRGSVSVGFTGSFESRVIVPVTAPTAVGLNLMFRLQLPPAAIGVVRVVQPPASVNCDAGEEDTLRLVRVSFVLLVDVFVSVALIVLVVPSASFPNETLAGENEAV